MPQSPEMTCLLTAMGCVDNSYTFGKCFRLIEDEDGITTNDNLIEFTQLDITSTFMTNHEGMSLINGMIEYIIDKGGYDKIIQLISCLISMQ